MTENQPITKSNCFFAIYLGCITEKKRKKEKKNFPPYPLYKEKKIKKRKDVRYNRVCTRVREGKS